MPLPTLSLSLKISLPCLLLGALLFGVSFSVDHWLKFSISDQYSGWAGLWKICVHDKNHDYTTCDTWTSDAMDRAQLSRSWIHKSQALECLTLIVMLGALGCSTLYTFLKLRLAAILSFVTSFVSVIFMISGCAVFASDVNDDKFYKNYADLDWAFGFNIVAAIFTTAAGIGLLLETIYSRSTTSTPS